MRRRFLFNLALKEPAETVTPTTLDEDGCVVCPACGGPCRTPVLANLYRVFRKEAMILVGGKMCNCPHCGVGHFISTELARKFNHRLFPGDRTFAQRDG